MPNTDKPIADKKKIGDPSPEAIEYAKRLIALKWTKETNVDTIACTWQAGYIFGQIDERRRRRRRQSESNSKLG